MSGQNVAHTLTLRGRRDIKKKLKQLRRERRRVRKDLDDFCLTEVRRQDEDYIAQIQNKLAFLNDEIAAVELILTHAHLLRKRPSKQRVGLGSKVKLRSNHGMFDLQLVDSAEAEPGAGKLSVESPLGRALLGQRIRSSVLVNAPRGKMRYDILQIA